jgi:hypothetical protein
MQMIRLVRHEERPAAASVLPTHAQLDRASEWTGRTSTIVSRMDDHQSQALLHRTNEESLKGTPVDEFLNNFRDSGTQCILTAYQMKRSIRTSNVSSSLSTALPEDVFTFIEAQTKLLDEYLTVTDFTGTKIGDSIVLDGILSILRNLSHSQTRFRTLYLVDFEYCIAVSNDLLRMIENIEKTMDTMAQRYDHLPWKQDEKGGTTAVSLVEQEAADLITLYSSDAVFASQRVASFVLESIQKSSIPTELFTHKWEDELVQNEIAVSMIRTFEDYLSEIYNHVEEDFLYHKIVAALARSTVCFYIQCFINKANRMRLAMKFDLAGKRTGKVAFVSTSRAIWRMHYDIEVFQDYFNGLTKDNLSLKRIVMNELYVLSILVECMWLAAGETSGDSFENFAVVVHKRTGADSIVTKHLLSDLWLLVGPKNKHKAIESAVSTMQEELQLVSNRLKENGGSPRNTSENEIPCSTLDSMLQNLYQDRIIQEQSSFCGNIIRDARELSRSLKQSKSVTTSSESEAPESIVDAEDPTMINPDSSATSVIDMESSMAEF